MTSMVMEIWNAVLKCDESRSRECLRFTECTWRLAERLLLPQPYVGSIREMERVR